MSTFFGKIFTQTCILVHNLYLLITKKKLPYQGLILWCVLLSALGALEVAAMAHFSSGTPTTLLEEYQLHGGESTCQFASHEFRLSATLK